MITNYSSAEKILIYRDKLKKKYSLRFIIYSLSFLIVFIVNWKLETENCFAQPVDYRAKFAQAEAFLLNENYERALPLYLELLTQDQNNANWNFKIGFCYLNSPTEVSKAVNYLEKAALKSSPKSKDVSYKEDKSLIEVYRFLGDAYHLNYRFDEAITSYQKFKTFLSVKDKFLIDDTDHRIQICNNAKEMISAPVNLIIKNMGAGINTEYPEYSPVISADESILLFTSRRPENVGGKVGEDGKYFEDIYISFNTEDSGWTKAKNIGAPINTSEHEATIGISADGQIVFIYKDDADSGSIYTTHMEGDFWTIPEKVGGDVNSKYWESHATISADGNTLYFVSNRPDGYGGRDIYRCKKLPTGEWSKAMNLGPKINTQYDEDASFLQPGEQTLSFSSKGHKGMGGFDIFYSNFIDSGLTGNWTEPVNIGYPVNTTGDDVFFVPTIDNKRAYFSSFSQSGYGDKDIYMLTFPEKEGSRLTVLRGHVTDDFGKIPTDVTITVVDANNGDMIGNYLPNPKTGKYLLILPHTKTYTIKYEGEGYYTVTNTVHVDPGKAYMETEMVLILKDVKMEKKTPGTVSVIGTVTDVQKKAVAKTNIVVKDNSSGTTIGTFVSNNEGKFSFVLERGKNYCISFEAEKYLFQSENVNLPKEMIYSSIEKNIILQPIVMGSKIVLKNLFFDFNKAKIRKESFVELDKLYNLLKENPNMRIELSGHTDNKGNKKLNLKLSQDRAKAVMNYIIKKGINKNQITSKGYGVEQPIVTNDTDEGRQLNRRVEMKILSK
ncbi:MAG: OmpA family protein [Bacteroidota bacterium]